MNKTPLQDTTTLEAITPDPNSQHCINFDDLKLLNIPIVIFNVSLLLASIGISYDKWNDFSDGLFFFGLFSAIVNSLYFLVVIEGFISSINDSLSPSSIPHDSENKENNNAESQK